MMDSYADGPFGILNWVSIVYSDVQGFSAKTARFTQTQIVLHIFM